MKENIPEEKSLTIFDHLPTTLGKAALEACLVSYPFAMICLNFTSTLAGKYFSIRNEKQTETLLNDLGQKITKLDNQRLLAKERLKENLAYQEVAHKRLLSISAMDSDEDLKLSATLISLCGILNGEDPKDMYLLTALGDITPNEVRLFLIAHQMQNEIDRRKSQFSDLESRDIQVENEMIEQVAKEFFKAGEELLRLFSFNHILGRIHSLGLTGTQPTLWGESNNFVTKVYPPKLTPLGYYFIKQLRLIENLESTFSKK